MITSTLIEQAKTVLANNGTILVAGVRPSNMGGWYNKGDRRLLFWFTDDSKKCTVPSNTGLILQTRFVDHELTMKIKNDRPDGAILHPKTLTPAEIRDLLSSAYPNEKEKPKEHPSVEDQGPVPSVLVQDLNKADGNGSSSPYKGWSDSARQLEKFRSGIPNLGEVIDNVLKQYQLFIRKEQECDELRRSIAPLQKQSTDLSMRVSELEGQIASTQDQLAELELYREEVAKVTADLKLANEALAQEKSRADKAEAELTAVQAAARQFFGVLKT